MTRRTGAHRQAAESAGATPLALVVEDDPGIARLLERYLVRARYDVVVASNGAEALALAADRRPAVITLDLFMPGMSGIDVLQRLSESEQTRGIPVIVISIRGDETELAIPPVFARLTKPIDRRRLIEVVAEATRDARQR